MTTRKRPKKYKAYPYFAKHPTTKRYYAHYIDAHGTRCRKSLHTKDQVIAAAKFTVLLKEVDQGVLGFSRMPRKLSFEDAANCFLKDGTNYLAAQTIRRHEGILRLHLVPYFKRTPFKAITPRKVHNYIRKRQRDEAAPNTIHKELAALSAVFNFARQEEWVQINPVLAVRKPKLDLVNPFYVPNEKEIEKILHQLYPRATRFFLALCHSGCRVAEISRANVRDADLERRVLRVVRKGNRLDFIPINETLVQVIQEELASRPEVKLRDPLFLNDKGSRYKSIKKSLATACRKAEVPRCTHHSLRHAYATMLHDSGARIATISKLLGHTNPTTTRNIYVHWQDSDVAEAAEAIKIGKKLAK